jgi:uncharacterized protein with HEPN domain
MAISVEYLVVMKKEKSACDTVDKLKTFLQFDSRIGFTGDLVQFCGERVCTLGVTTGDVPAKHQRYFHLKFVGDHDPITNPVELGRFVDFLSALRVSISQLGGELEQLRNEVSNFYAQQAYPIIQEVENTMRQLITNFMMVNVGLNWIEGTMPEEVNEAIQKSAKRSDSDEYADKDNLNILYKLDFKHLGNFLFDPYTQKTATELYRYLAGTESVSSEELKLYLPRSNWQRYFADLIRCEDQFLKIRWNKLYLLRNKVAHNAIMSEQDLIRIRTLADEILPKLKSALLELSQVTVPAAEVEAVAENAASTESTTVGEFILNWQKLESTLLNRLPSGTNALPYSDELFRRGLLRPDLLATYNRLRRMRNLVVHNRGVILDESVIKTATAEIDELVDWIENESYVGWLRALGVQERKEWIDQVLCESSFDILNSDEVSSAMAETNAGEFEVDQIDISDISFDDDYCLVKFEFDVHGRHFDDDRMFSGDTISGSGEARIDSSGLLEFEVLSAHVKDWDQDEDDDVDPSETPSNEGNGND